MRLCYRLFIVDLLLILCFAAGIAAPAQTPAQYTVTGNLGGIGNAAKDVLQVRFTLANCGQANPVVPGITEVVRKIIVYTADQTGAFTGTLWGNDQVSCNLGFTTVYQVTYLRNNVPTGVTSIYRVLGPGPFDLTSATPVATLPSVNMPASGYLCPAGKTMVGIHTDWTPECRTVTPGGAACAEGECLHNFPSDNQTVAQPGATTLKTNSLNYVRYVDPSSSTNIVTQINTLFASCGYACEVHIPAGNYTAPSGTVLINHATQSLTGDGKDKVRITYGGTNFLDWRYSAATYDFNASGEVSGFTITCTNAAAICMSGGSVIGATWKDLNIYGPAGIVGQQGSPGTSQGLVFQNTFDWMERWSIRNVNMGGFSKNIHFLRETAQGTNSYGYGLVDGLFMNIGPGCIGVFIEGGSVYNVLSWVMQFNAGGTTGADEVFRVGTTFTGENFHATGENAGANITFAHLLPSSIFQFQGDWTAFAGGIIIDQPAAAGLVTAPFSILPAINGYAQNVAGAPSITNYAGSGQTVATYPTQSLITGNPYVTARMGYVSAASGASAPVLVYDGIPLCFGVIHAGSQGQPLSNITPTFCVDPGGYITANGASFTGTLTTNNILTSGQATPWTYNPFKHGAIWHNNGNSANPAEDMFYHANNKAFVIQSYPLSTCGNGLAARPSLFFGHYFSDGGSPDCGMILDDTGMLEVRNGITSPNYNGVALTHSGSANAYLDATGHYSVPAGGGGGGGGSMVYPSAGVAVTDGFGWLSSYSTTGTGTALVRSISPALVTPDLGTPSAVNLLHAVALPLDTGTSGVLPASKGGTGTTSTAAVSVNMPRWRNALRAVKNGTGNAIVCTVGDSTTVGYNSNTPGSPSFSYPTQLAQILRQSYGIKAHSQAVLGGGALDGGIADPRFVAGAGWSLASSGAFGTFGGVNAFEGSSTGVLAFTPTTAVDTFKVIYLKETTEGAGSIAIDAGSATAFNANAASGIGTITLTAGSVGTHTLNISRSSGTIHIISIAAWDSTTPQVIIYRGGGGGSNAFSLGYSTGLPYQPGSSTLMAAVGCDLIIDRIGQNDWNGGTSVSGYATSVQTFTTEQLASGADVILMSPTPSKPADFPLAPTTTQLAFVSAMRSVAAANSNTELPGVPLTFIDAYTEWADFDTAYALGLYGADNQHPNAAGYRQIAEQVASAIAQTPGQNSGMWDMRAQLQYNPAANTLRSTPPFIAPSITDSGVTGATPQCAQFSTTGLLGGSGAPCPTTPLTMTSGLFAVGGQVPQGVNSSRDTTPSDLVLGSFTNPGNGDVMTALLSAGGHAMWFPNRVNLGGGACPPAVIGGDGVMECSNNENGGGMYAENSSIYSRSEEIDLFNNASEHGVILGVNGTAEDYGVFLRDSAYLTTESMDLRIGPSNAGFKTSLMSGGGSASLNVEVDGNVSLPVLGTAGGMIYAQPTTRELAYVNVTATGTGAATFNAATGTLNIPMSSGSGGGSVNSFSAGSLSPLFSTSVANATSTPALTFTLSTAAAHTFLGNNTASTAAPAYFQPNFTDLAGSIAAGQFSVATACPTCVVAVAGSTSGGFTVSQSGTTTRTISVAADGTHYLPTTTDQTTWNAKQAAGSYITGLTGDATATGPGSVAITVNKAGNVKGGVLGSLHYQSAVDTTATLAPNTSTARQFVIEQGTGTGGAAPTLGPLVSGDIPDNAANTSGTAANATTAANAVALGGITVTGTPAPGYVPTATSTTAATWQAPTGGSGSFQANGAALAASSPVNFVSGSTRPGVVVSNPSLGNVNFDLSTNVPLINASNPFTAPQTITSTTSNQLTVAYDGTHSFAVNVLSGGIVQFLTTPAASSSSTGYNFVMSGRTLQLYRSGSNTTLDVQSTTENLSLLPTGASVIAPLYATLTNCASSASPAVCASASSGAVVVAAGATTVQVNTTRVGANSQIQLTFDASLSTRLGVTCNTTPSQPWVSARTAASNFTITTTAPTTNPACFNYTIINQ